MTIWYILYSFGTFFPVLVSCTKKNLATLLSSTIGRRKNFYPAFFFFQPRSVNEKKSSVPHQLICGRDRH
jgi:hypothetical protein